MCIFKIAKIFFTCFIPERKGVTQMTIFINPPRIFKFNNKNYMYINQEFEGNLDIGYNPHDRQRGIYQVVPSKNPDSYSHVDLKPIVLAEKHVERNGDVTFSRKNFLTGESLFADKLALSDKFEVTKGSLEQLGNIVEGQIEILSENKNARRLIKKIGYMIKNL